MSRSLLREKILERENIREKEKGKKSGGEFSGGVWTRTGQNLNTIWTDWNKTFRLFQLEWSEIDKIETDVEEW